MPLIELKTQLTNLQYGQDQYGINPQTDTSGVPHYTPDTSYTSFIGLPDASVNLSQWKFYKTGNNLQNLVGPLVSKDNKVNLKTQLLSQPYTLDVPGGGSSGQPFIQLDIPGVDNNAPTNYYDLNRLPDGQQRGGIASNYDRQYDLKRINSFFGTTRGKIFLQNQKNLQLSNPKIETGTIFATLNDVGSSSGISSLFENTRIYNTNGETTLAQIAVAGTGEHIPRQGYLVNSDLQQYYADTVNFQNVNNDPTNNRLALLYNLKMRSDKGLINNTVTFLKDLFSNGSNPFTNSGNQNILSNIANLALASQLGISTDRHFIQNYAGGPGSTYGVGNTTIPRYEDTTRIVNGNATMTYDNLRSQVSTKDGVANIKDFRANTSLKKSAWNYTTDSLENRLKIGNPGKNSKPYDYKVSISGSKDELNSLFPFVLPDSEGDSAYSDNPDMIKFGFECLNNDDPNNSTFLLFRAFLTSGLTDNNSAQFNSFKYMGRGETFYTYQGFERSVNFSFRLFAQTRDEMQPMYNRLNYLISQVYPDYSPVTSIMRAPIVKLTIGDYMYRMPGILESINVTIDNNYPWEINLEKDKSIKQLPHVLDVSVGFKPIFINLPKRSIGSSNQTPLISDSSYIA